MKNGIFRKLLWTYILIVVAIVAVLSFSMSQFFKAYFFQEKQKELFSVGRQLETELIRFRRGDISKQQLAGQINTIGRATNSRIIIIDSRQPLDDLQDSELDKEFQGFLKNVLKGSVVAEQYHYSSELDTYVVAVGLPTASATENKGAILLFAPVYEVASALDNVYRIILISSIVATALGLILVWYNSRKISRPIVELSVMSSQIAQGKNIDDLSIAADGEVGHLIDSFNSMKNQLARTEKMRHEFIAGVSHELRTPLTSLRGAIQGILDGIVPAEDQRKYLKMAFQETGRLTRLTNDLLELTKLEAGVVKLSLVEVPLKDLLEQSVLTVQGGEGSRHANPEISVQPEGLTVSGDPDRLKQVFINLLSNAYKHTPEDGQVSIIAFVEAGGVQIHFADTGEGIPADEIPLIFEKFHRVDKSRSSAAGGSGLGLSIVKNLVELHGGTVSVESSPGNGSLFKVTLPR